MFPQLWLLKEWVDVDWVVQPGIDNATYLETVPPHLVECHDRAKNNSESYVGVCPSEGFYFTIVCLGKVMFEGNHIFSLHIQYSHHKCT